MVFVQSRSGIFGLSFSSLNFSYGEFVLSLIWISLLCHACFVSSLGCVLFWVGIVDSECRLWLICLV
ncbi:hypothetical protein PRUPE_7G098900 [Prunus persica]|uniref:Uncharacterized protein n=1 Tax=Prunus persica TaxID=3760 RepID=A0A251N9F3_PRUPE|nr:hypothetical protein PRUPE_7G098900 [Prunus persica]